MSIDHQTAPHAESAVGAEPWIGYDSQAVPTIKSFVSKASPTQARVVRDYESERLDRADIIAAADRRLEQWHA
jgi:hypothetical protein